MAPAGYNYEVISDNLKELSCPVCKHLIRNCVELPCAHCMCKNCIEYLNVQAKEMEIDTNCPTCDTVYIMEWVKESKAMDRIIRTSVKIKCPQVQLGCDWQGEISSLEWHETLCKFKMVQCDYDGCDGVVMRCNMEKHMDICEYRIGFCDHCSLELHLNELEEHSKTCLFHPVACPNEDCRVDNIIRKELADHLAKDCVHEKKPCELVNIGCKEKVKRSEIQYHFAEFIYEHTCMLQSHSNDLYTMWNDTKQELEETNTNLAKTTAVLMETLKKLAETRKELIATQDDLESTKQKLSELPAKAETTISNAQQNSPTNKDLDDLRKELEDLKLLQREQIDKRREDEEKRKELEIKLEDGQNKIQELQLENEKKRAKEVKELKDLQEELKQLYEEKERALVKAQDTEIEKERVFMEAKQAEMEKETVKAQADLKRQMKEAKSELEKEKEQAKSELEKEKFQAKSELEKEKLQAKSELEKEILQAKAELEKEKVDAKSELEKEKMQVKAELEREKLLLTKSTDVESATELEKSNKEADLKRKHAKKAKEELKDSTAHIAYPQKALPPEPVDEVKVDPKPIEKVDDSPIYSKVQKPKKNVMIVQPQKDDTEPKEEAPESPDETPVKKPKRYVEPLKDGAEPMENQPQEITIIVSSPTNKVNNNKKETKEKSDPKNNTNNKKPVSYIEPLKDNSRKIEESINNGDTPKKEPAANNKINTKENNKKDAKEQHKQDKRNKQQDASKGNTKRPDSPLLALVDSLNTDSIPLYCDSYYALMVKLETDRFYRINNDMFVKINTRGLLRPYDIIYLQPWEERDRMAFQELQYSRRIMHFTDRVAIEVGAKTAIIKLLAGCTTSSATAAILHTQQPTCFLPAFVDKWGWGYNVPIGQQRSAFYSQDHILVRLRRRPMSRDNIYGGV